MIAALLQTPSDFHTSSGFKMIQSAASSVNSGLSSTKEEEEKNKKISSLIEHDFVHLGPEKALPKIISR